MDNSKKKSKEKQEAHGEDANESMNIISRDQPFPPMQQTPSLDLYLPPPSSSSSTEPELIHEEKRLKLTLHDHQPDSSSPGPVQAAEQAEEIQTLHRPLTPPPPSPTSPKIQLSSIPPAHCRPFFNHPPHAHPTQPSTGPGTASCSGFSIRQNIAATLRLLKPIDRAKFRLTGQMRRNKQKPNEVSEAGRVTLPGPSPLGPGPTPYEKVEKSLAELKHFINTLANPDTTEQEKPSAQTSTSKEAEVDKWSLTVEDVIELLDEYMKRVPRTIDAQEMEDGLLEIQNRVGVDPRPTWYASMCKSYQDMWESLIDYFGCDALDKAHQMEEDVLKD